MHSFFTDPKTFIKFIDARGQYFRYLNLGRLPLSNIPDAKYDEAMMKGGGKSKDSRKYWRFC